jgi:hypothetical protein
MPCQSQVGKVFTKVVHDYDLVFDNLLNFSVHYFEWLSLDTGMVYDPFIAFSLYSFHMIVGLG